MQLYSFTIYKYNVKILLHLSDSAQHRRSYILVQRCHISALTHAMALILSNNVILSPAIITLFKYCHARVILCNAGEVSIFGASAVYLNFETCYEVDMKQLCSSSINECNISILSHLSNFMKCNIKSESMFSSFLHM